MISKNNDYSQMTDKALVISAQQGNMDAENEILKRFNDTVRLAAAAYYKDHSSYCDSGLLDTDDLIQEGSIGLLSAIYTFNPELNVLFKTYASRCIENALSSAAKAGSSKKHTPPGPVVPFVGVEIPSPNSPEEDFLAKCRCNEIKLFLSEDLSAKERSVIRLYLSGASYKEISLQLQTSEKSVDNTMQRIRAKLRSFLYSNRS